MMTSSDGNILRVTGHLCGEFTGQRCIPPTKASDAELWCIFLSAWINGFSQQSWGCWFQTPSRPLWRHCNGYPVMYVARDLGGLPKLRSLISPLWTFWFCKIPVISLNLNYFPIFEGCRRSSTATLVIFERDIQQITCLLIILKKNWQNMESMEIRLVSPPHNYFVINRINAWLCRMNQIILKHICLDTGLVPVGC